MAHKKKTMTKGPGKIKTKKEAEILRKFNSGRLEFSEGELFNLSLYFSSYCNCICNLYKSGYQGILDFISNYFMIYCTNYDTVNSSSVLCCVSHCFGKGFLQENLGESFGEIGLVG